MMNKKRLLLSLLLIIICPIIILAYTSRPKEHNLRHAIINRTTFLEPLADSSTYIAHGRVTKRHLPITVDEAGLHVETPVTVSIISAIKNPGDKKELIYMELGGTVGSLHTPYPNEPLQIGEEVVIFITLNTINSKQGILRVDANSNVTYRDIKQHSNRTLHVDDFLDLINDYYLLDRRD